MILISKNFIVLSSKQINYFTIILLIMQVSLKHQVVGSLLHPKYFSNSTTSTHTTVIGHHHSNVPT